jgi:hypothetical protein
VARIEFGIFDHVTRSPGVALDGSTGSRVDHDAMVYLR